jgi:hypothetical protein
LEDSTVTRTKKLFVTAAFVIAAGAGAASPALADNYATTVPPGDHHSPVGPLGDNHTPVGPLGDNHTP